ncbi:MAG TPA: alpha/beta hydrolase [Pseudonocardia sp.]
MRAGTVPAVLGGLGVGAVAGAYRPMLRRWPLSMIGALPSAFASETPALVAGVQAVAAASALRGEGWRRAAGVGLNAAALAGLAGLAGDARRSGRALSEALAQTGLLPPGELPARRPAGVLQGHLARRRYRRVADISYSEHGPYGTLDVWHRADLPSTGRAPVLLQVHGGAWTMGDKLNQAEPLLGYLAERGWVCVTVNYRLAPAHRWPAMVVDVKRAIAWIREYISGHGGDPDFVAVTGGSAGGHLAALAALSANDPDYQPGFTEIDTTLRAAVPLYGVHDFTEDHQGLFALLEGKIMESTMEVDPRTWRQASPALRVGPEAPPFLIVHGSTDAIVGVRQSRLLAAALRERSPAPVGYAELPHAQHGFDGLPTARTAYTVDAVHRFLAAVHRDYRSGAGETGRNRATAAR